MGFLNGQSNSSKTIEKGEKGDRGVGFSLTADEHYHIKNKRLTNVSSPVDNSDATTKKFVTDLLKTKAGTTYVNNELAKKANQTTLANYALVADVQTALGDKLEQSDLNIINNTLLVLNNFKADKSDVDNALALKANQSDLNTALNQKADKIEITILNNTVNSIEANKTDTADFNSSIQNINNYITFPKPKVTIYAEENGAISYNAFEWSFGNGATQQNYGFPIPIASRILYGAISSTANNSAPGEIIAAIVVNGQEVGSNITKPAGYFSTTIVLNPPIELNPGDRINFRSKNNNHQVTQTIISLIIELDL